MTDCDKLLEEVRALGMDYKWAKMFVKKFANDEKAYEMTAEQKKWALTKGFFPGRIKLYGLNEENYKDYIPDYNYFMMHPINHHFKIWVNDKLTLKYVLNSCGCESSMPEYYLYVENDKRYTYLFDAPKHIKKDKDFLFNLLKEKGILAMKPNSGTSGGLGFIKLEYVNGKLIENNKEIDMARYNEILSSMKNYVVTEYVKQHDELSKIWADSECTLRVIMCKMPKDDVYTEDKWQCVASLSRFGSSISGGASNLSSGGVGIGFDYETGKFKEYGIRYRQFCKDENIFVYEHPDTHVKWQGSGLPNWQSVKQMIEKICLHVSSLCYLGFDVIITNDGMKLCEINTHPGGDYSQVQSGAFLKNDNVRKFFDSKGLWSFDANDFYQAYLRCQK